MDLDWTGLDGAVKPVAPHGLEESAKEKEKEKLRTQDTPEA